jgi:hypothetical protein
MSYCSVILSKFLFIFRMFIMTVTGYLSLYTTLIGWEQYQHLWSLMVGTGLVFVPFIGIILQCFLEPFESQEPKSAAVIALRRLMIRIVGALIAIEFCCVPSVLLDPKVLHFEPVCVASPASATPGHTGTTYDNQFEVPTGVKVPVLWYLVMAISNGFTHAAIKGLNCSAIDYQSLQDHLNVNHLSDPALKKETIDFYEHCYVPSYSKYMAKDLSEDQQAQFQRYQLRYGQDDVGWIGSQSFLNVSGFYDIFSAGAPIEGFAYDPTRDQFEGQVSEHSEWGQPSCQAWWQDSQAGLRKRLETALLPTFLQTITHQSESPEVLADIGIRALIQHSFDAGMNTSEISRGYESMNDALHENILGELADSLGVIGHEFTYYPKLYLLINALPIIQALLLLGIYALLALVIHFSSYRLHFIITGSAIIFAITFWSYLWQVVAYLDNSLIAALYPTDPSAIIPSWHELIQGGGGAEATFVHFIIGTLYIVLPLLFLTLMSWTGLKVSSAIMGAVSDMQAPGNVAGSMGASMASKVGKMIMKR